MGLHLQHSILRSGHVQLMNAGWPQSNLVFGSHRAYFNLHYIKLVEMHVPQAQILKIKL